MFIGETSDVIYCSNCNLSTWPYLHVKSQVHSKNVYKNKSEQKYVCSFQSSHLVVVPTNTHSPPHLSLLPRTDLLHGILGKQRVMIISILEVRRFNGEVVWFVQGFAKALRQTEKRIHFSWPPCLCLVCKAACLPSNWQNYWQGRRPYWSCS